MKINIGFTSSDEYSNLLGVAMISILENNKDTKLCFYVIDYGISDSNKSLLKTQLKNYNNVELIFIENNSDKLNKIDLNKSKNYEVYTYTRLILPSLLPDDVETILFLDCDIICSDSLRDLNKIDISEYYLGAVEESTNYIIKKNAYLSEEDQYFNAGVLLINLKKWREDKIEDVLLDFFYKNQPFYHAEQDVLNYLFVDKIFKLDLKFNLTTWYHNPYYESFFNFVGSQLAYSSKDVELARKNPVFIHFNGGNLYRPWMNKHHPYRDLYEKYMSYSSFEDFLISDNVSFKARLYHLLITNIHIYFQNL